jgi:hypothetical protein
MNFLYADRLFYNYWKSGEYYNYLFHIHQRNWKSEMSEIQGHKGISVWRKWEFLLSVLCYRIIRKDKFEDTIDVTISKRKKKPLAPWHKPFTSSCGNWRHRKIWLLSTKEIWKAELQRRMKGEVYKLKDQAVISLKKTICDW